MQQKEEMIDGGLEEAEEEVVGARIPQWEFRDPILGYLAQPLRNLVQPWQERSRDPHQDWRLGWNGRQRWRDEPS